MLFFGLLVSATSHTQPIRPAPQLRAPTEGLPTDLGDLIEAIFSWSLNIIGLLLFIRFLWAGVIWFTAAGNSSKISQAKDIMWNAVLGTIVLFSAYLILYTINPNLVSNTINLRDPGTVGQPPVN